MTHQYTTTVAAQGERVKNNGDLIKKLIADYETLKAIPKPKPLKVHNDVLKAALVESGIPHELSNGKQRMEINSVQLTRVGDYWYSDDHPLILMGKKFAQEFVT